jgi:cyclic-di-AMP phosphodiesterase PgpH
MTDELPLWEQDTPRLGHRVRSQDIPWGARLRVISIWLLALLVGSILLVVPLPFSGQVALKVGDVAPADVVAPRQATYASDIETQRRRDAAANAAVDIYDPPQARIARQQLSLANQNLSFIASVRNDSYAGKSTQAAYLGAMKGLELPPAMIDHILSLPDAAWERTAEEVPIVLDQAMRSEIRESSLGDERRKVPARVRLDLSDEDAAVVTYIVQSLLVPNSIYNAAKTEERRQLARNQVEPATATIVRNEVILRAGDIVTAADMEALNALGLKQSSWDRQKLGAVAGILLALGLVFLYYLWRQEPQSWLDPRQMPLLAGMLVTFIVAARIVVPTHALLVYVFPYAALAMLLAVLINLRVALVASFFFTLVVGWLTTGSVELMAYAFAGSVVGALKLRRGENLSRFAWAACFVVYANLLVVLGFRLAASQLDLRGLAELSAASLVNGVLVIAVSLLGSYLIGALFDITTPLQLMEISRPTHPLLRLLLLKAPGTYHHTLVVSNMAERAAEAIGADAQLARVGAYYHDVGKTIRPYFFTENRTEGQDPHARLDPYTSAQIIIGHVRDGVELARKYRLPGRIIDFIPEHHGTLLVSFFYHQAIKQAGSVDAVDRSQFTYPGPRPRSRETAITMLADGAEATVRAKHPGSSEEIARIVHESIQTRVAASQLDDSSITFGDLEIIQRAFVDVLRGIHHPRVTYPAETREEQPAGSSTPEGADLTNVPAPAQDAAPSAT